MGWGEPTDSPLAADPAGGMSFSAGGTRLPLLFNSPMNGHRPEHSPGEAYLPQANLPQAIG